VEQRLTDMNSRFDGDLAFSFRTMKDRSVTILRDGNAVTVLRGVAALRFLVKVGGATRAEQQQLMARATRNYKRGTERLPNGPFRNHGPSDS
jgi:hypothetical protein